ncbi:hypothetical protein pEaSNUABM37_00100 [Erwinia phage pEa_SNUABM_37]|nr:hypothetical protein pEaSNUABM37_00100 [Erwinia phage pEa_SNUABM_37]QXO10570.1 hypothetical protein pEaSNUABM48_00100 [Erwinia phage pEa_SNUABM_48]
MSSINLDSPGNVKLREVLQDLALVRSLAQSNNRPVNTAIRNRCKEIIKDPNMDKMIKDVALHISRKTLCSHTLTVAISSYNEMANGEVEMIRDGEVVSVNPGNQNPIG